MLELLQDILKALKELIFYVLRRLEQGDRIMAAIDDLGKSVQSLQAGDALVLQKLADQKNQIAALANQVADLQAQLAEESNLDPQISAAAAAIMAEVQKLQDAIA